MPIPPDILRDHYSSIKQACEGELTVLDSRISKERLRSVPVDTHKGELGHAVVIAGSDGYYGAPILCTEACLRAGCGLVSALLPGESILPLMVRLPEAIVINGLHDLGRYDAIGFGPGTGMTRKVYEILRECLLSRKKLVIDADGITLLARHPDLVELLHHGVVLTPHEKEFDRLTGRHNSRLERFITQQAFVKRYEVTLVLKGSATIISNKDHSFINSSGNQGMATAGSGDVLTGIITGLLASGHECSDAAIIGVFEHGKAGDRAAELLGERSLIASDIIRHLNFGK